MAASMIAVDGADAIVAGDARAEGAIAGPAVIYRRPNTPLRGRLILVLLANRSPTSRLLQGTNRSFCRANRWPNTKIAFQRRRLLPWRRRSRPRIRRSLNWSPQFRRLILRRIPRRFLKGKACRMHSLCQSTRLHTLQSRKFPPIRNPSLKKAPRKAKSRRQPEHPKRRAQRRNLVIAMSNPDRS